MDAAQLYAEADYTAFNAGHRARYEVLRAFLARHDLANAFDDGDSLAGSTRRSARRCSRRRSDRPGPVPPEELLTRVQWLRDRNAALGEDVRELREQRLRARVRRAVGAPVRRILNR